VRILGAEENNFWKDHKAAKINALRTQTLIEKSDIVVVHFGDTWLTASYKV
jgi:lactate dehydrogenase-like 2-hydroxyacid dehydrogenase